MNQEMANNYAAWIIYSIICFLILLPFIESGILKIASISIILGFFGSLLNAIKNEIKHKQ